MGTSVTAPVVKHAPSAPAESVPEIPADGVHKLTKVVIITRQNKLDEFMQAMNEIGVTGITITNVMGCGVQKGAPTYYRGVEVDMNLRPKVKIEIVVSLVPVQKVIDTAKEVLHTGQIGDGKMCIRDSLCTGLCNTSCNRTNTRLRNQLYGNIRIFIGVFQVIDCLLYTSSSFHCCSEITAFFLIGVCCAEQVVFFEAVTDHLDPDWKSCCVFSAWNCDCLLYTSI